MKVWFVDEQFDFEFIRANQNESKRDETGTEKLTNFNAIMLLITGIRVL